MPVPVQTPSIIHTGNGVTTVFAFPFKVSVDSTIKVTVGALVQVLGVDYTVSGSGSDSGSVTMTAPPAAGAVVTIYRQTPLARTRDYQQSGDLLSDTVDADFDDLWMALQELDLSGGGGGGDTSDLETRLGDGSDAGNGAGMVAYNPARTYAAGTVGAALNSGTGGGGANYDDLVGDYGAIGDRATDNTTVVNDALAESVIGPIFVPNGDFVVSANPTNPNGRQFVGPGKILKPDGAGFEQLNSYADSGIVVGREYLYRAYRRISLQGSSVLRIFIFGDSTSGGYVAPPSVLPVDFLPQNLLPHFLRSNGVAAATVTNRSVSGTKWSDLNAIPDLTSTSDLLIIKYGINDGVPVAPGDSVAVRLEAMAMAMRSKLSAIRATTYGALSNCSIILMGPSTVNDTPNGRNEEWLEAVRDIYVQCARDYQCCYFDTYGWLQDSRFAATAWMDQPWGDNRAVHPLDIGNAWIWGGLVMHIFPRELMANWSQNRFQNRAATGNVPPHAAIAQPGTYPFGITWELASTAFPDTGFLATLRQADTYAVQHLFTLSGRTYTRYAASGASWHAFFTGQSVDLSLGSGWSNLGGSWQNATAVRDDSGRVSVEGVISKGSAAVPGEIVATLPGYYRPSALQRYVVDTGAGRTSAYVDSSGGIHVDAPDAGYTSLSGISFQAATS